MEIETKKAINSRLNKIYISVSNKNSKGVILREIADLQYYLKEMV